MITVALVKSLANRNWPRNVARSATPASAARAFDNATMSGLYSMPSAVAPRSGRRDDRPAVARAQVNHGVLGLHLCHVQHRLDQFLAGRDPHDIFALLAHGRVVGQGRRGLLFSGLRQACDRRGQREREQLDRDI